MDLRDLYDSLQDVPYPMNVWAIDDPANRHRRHFLKFSKVYNTELAFGSISTEHDPKPIPGHGIPAVRINGEMTYRWSDLYRNPATHQRPLWGQHWLIDPEESFHYREENLTGNQNAEHGRRGAHDPEVLRMLVDMVGTVHPLATIYFNAGEIYQRAKEQCIRQGREVGKPP